MSLRSLWCALSGLGCAETVSEWAAKYGDSPSVQGGTSNTGPSGPVHPGVCLYGTSMLDHSLCSFDEEARRQCDAWEQQVLAEQYRHYQPVKLHSMDPELIREVKMFKTRHPVSGIPTDDAERKRYQAWTFLVEYFPDTFLAVVEVAIAGNEQHNPGQPLHWARGKSKDQLNSGFKHLFEYGRGVKRDTDGQYHLAKAIWRLSAQLQLDIEAERNQEEKA